MQDRTVSAKMLLGICAIPEINLVWRSNARVTPVRALLIAAAIIIVKRRLGGKNKTENYVSRHWEGCEVSERGMRSHK